MDKYIGQVQLACLACLYETSQAQGDEESTLIINEDQVIFGSNSSMTSIWRGYEEEEEIK